jgi:hypothetical protein
MRRRASKMEEKKEGIEGQKCGKIIKNMTNATFMWM